MSVVGQGLQYGWDNISIWQALIDGALAAGSVFAGSQRYTALGFDVGRRSVRFRAICSELHFAR